MVSIASLVHVAEKAASHEKLAEEHGLETTANFPSCARSERFLTPNSGRDSRVAATYSIFFRSMVHVGS